MTGEQAIDLLMQRLGNRTDTSLRAKILSEMLLTQQTELEEGPTKPWFLHIDDKTTLATAAGQEYVDLSTLNPEFLSFGEEWGGVWYDTGATDESARWQKMTRRSYVAMQQRSALGYDPTVWTYDVVGSSLYLRPIPDDVTALRIKYYGRDSNPADNSSTNLWLTHAADVLVAQTGIKMCMFHTRDDGLIPNFEKALAAAYARLRAANTLHEMSDMTASMGDD